MAVSPISDIDVFVRVVEQKSFSAAGKELGMSASTVSKHIARLEKKLGVRLVQRTTRNFYLSDAGEELYRGCVEGLREIEAACAAAASLGQNVEGTLRVHASMSLGQAVILPLMAEFMARNPNLQLVLDMGSPGVDPMDGQYDVAFRTNALHERSQSKASLRRRALGAVAYACVAAPSYLARRGPIEGPADLAGHDCLVLTTQKRSDLWQFTVAGAETVVRVPTRFASNNWLAVKGAALAGHGVARLAAYAVKDEVASGALVRLFGTSTRSEQVIQAIFPYAPHTPAKTRQLVSFMEEQLARIHPVPSDVADEG